ncbi:DUF4239 domain-containing protein [Paraburkholderia caballeronis]|uniref:bestrophin-like domain n=1 Tax=Paraburkholderia caballeronis TaxID=416943 RepID=UPI0010662912|nr:DUF4239 domain-containing protein [Paraburkholderia caballeronis]TDV09513.1 uncharacterized protein DUF4239 [Paraburkholderia caballeronis]TDV13784.1 uncharacterized protein DUF4239 [Paraburkholderia caballeronis]TDV22966.1 uncharacterized protein DUF4239 [Paraburkholderia caballeronis]TDV28652.1 uncharacterized protein DUF4239 [Paraburkholderia caballeronis]
MHEIASALLVFVLLLGGTGLGVLLRPLVPEEHKAHETVQLVQLVVGMLVTFAALVLGLLTASAKSSFDDATTTLRTYAAELIQLDTRLRDYGDGANDVRARLRSYTAGAIASTWPADAPPGDYYPRVRAQGGDDLESTQLGVLLDSVGREIRALAPRDRYEAALVGELATQFERVSDTRWRLIEEAHSSISKPFFTMLTLWLIVIFLSFGLIAPRNALALVTIMLGAVSIASAVYVIVDLDTPFDGPIVIASDSMRDALAHMSRPQTALAP